MLQHAIKRTASKNLDFVPGTHKSFINLSTSSISSTLHFLGISLRSSNRRISFFMDSLKSVEGSRLSKPLDLVQLVSFTTGFEVEGEDEADLGCPDPSLLKSICGGIAYEIMDEGSGHKCDTDVIPHKKSRSLVKKKGKPFSHKPKEGLL